MKKKRAIVAAAVLALVLLVGGILAYFTDTDQRSNVFTIGNVDIVLTEADWTPVSGQTGKYERAEAKNLTPKAVVPKAPVVENAGSNDAYIFVKVTIPTASVKLTSGATATTQELFTFAPNTGWRQLSHTGNEYVLVYATGTGDTINKTDMTKLLKKSGSTNTASAAAFTQVQLIDYAEMVTAPESIEIGVQAYAIQADNVTETTASAIWTLFNA